MLNLVERRNLWYIISLLVILPGLLCFALFGVRLGIDFTGGTVWELQFPRTDLQTLDVRQTVIAAGVPGAEDPLVQIGGGEQANTQTALIRLRNLREGSPEKARIADALRAKYGTFTELRLENVGPSVGQTVSQNSVLAVAAASTGILLFLAYAFRKVKRPFLYGICAIVAMLHDVLVVLGIFAILGKLLGYEIDALFVTALLTVIGFSVHDTIVVFDRIRENQLRRPAMDFAQVVNYSLNQTLVRSINTSLTVVFTLLALLLFGGVTVRTFILTLLIGVLSGTYSSIFNASQLLVSWERGDIQRWFRFRRHRSSGPRPAGAVGD